MCARVCVVVRREWHPLAEWIRWRSGSSSGEGEEKGNFEGAERGKAGVGKGRAGAGRIVVLHGYAARVVGTNVTRATRVTSA